MEFLFIQSFINDLLEAMQQQRLFNQGINNLCLKMEAKYLSLERGLQWISFQQNQQTKVSNPELIGLKNGEIENFLRALQVEMSCHFTYILDNGLIFSSSQSTTDMFSHDTVLVNKKTNPTVSKIKKETFVCDGKNSNKSWENAMFDLDELTGILDGLNNAGGERNAPEKMETTQSDLTTPSISPVLATDTPPTFKTSMKERPIYSPISPAETTSDTFQADNFSNYQHDKDGEAACLEETNYDKTEMDNKVNTNTNFLNNQTENVQAESDIEEDNDEISGEKLKDLNKLLKETVDCFHKAYEVKTGKRLLRKQRKVDIILPRKQKKLLLELVEKEFPKELRRRLQRTAEHNLQIMNAIGCFSMRLVQFCANPIKFFCEEF